jgi:hypothetical protein
MRPRWRTGISADGHSVLIDSLGRAFITKEVAVMDFELLQLPDPPATERRSSFENRRNRKNRNRPGSR